MKTIFWNVDTQYDFMRPEGKLSIAEAQSIESNLEKLTKLAAEKGIQVVNTADWHTNYSEELSNQPDYKKTFPEHCMAGTEGAEYVPATKPEQSYTISWQDKHVNVQDAAKSRNITLYKDAFDVFKGNQHTDELLNAIRPDRIIVYGVATNVCVDYAVRGLAARNKEVYVVKDAIKELPGLPLEETLKGWEGKATLINTLEVADHIR